VLFSPFSASNPRGRSKEEMEVEEKEQESELDMVSNSSFMQSNVQHSFAASRLISRAVSVKGIYMTLIQELWYQEGILANRIFQYVPCSPQVEQIDLALEERDGLYATRIHLQGHSSSSYKYNKEGAERRLVVCSAYLPYDSEDPPPSKELEELVRYSEYENLYLVLGCDSNAHHSV